MGQYLSGESRQKLLFVSNADNKPEDKHEISDSVLFRFLLNEETLNQLDETETIQMPEIFKDMDKNAKIVEFETHQSRMKRATQHVFVLFRTTSETNDGVYWWSLEKSLDSIVLQRSRNKDSVKNKYDGEERQQVKSIREGLKGKGTIQDLFEILWAQQMIPEEKHIWKSNCQSLVTFISQQMTEIGYESKGFFKYYSPLPENGRNKKMLDLINILKKCSDLSPLFTLLQVGNIDLFDEIVASGKHDINAFYRGMTPLHFAIRLEENKMVQHLLKDPMNADPTTSDAFGMSALLLASTITTKTEIFDLLLAHSKVKVDDVDGDGRTALHLAAGVSNVIAVQKLIAKGADPNIFDKEGRSPLHVAAQQRDASPIIDLLLEAQKVKGIGDVNDRDARGRTALHYAAASSNEITGEHLIKKGADANQRDNNGDTPLHVAAVHAKDMQIIDVLLLKMKDDYIKQQRNEDKLLNLAYRNENLLGAEIAARLEKPKSWANKILGVPRHVIKKYANPSVKAIYEVIFYFLQLDRLRVENAKISQEMDEILKERRFDINFHDQDGDTPLLVAIRVNNVNGVRLLLEKGADPTRRNNEGLTPFQVAATQNKEFEILDLLLANDKVDINDGGKSGYTVLHFAMATSDVTAARFLLSKGANPNVADENGVTPLHLAADFAKDLDIVELLVNHKDVVNVNSLDNSGQNAQHCAQQDIQGQSEGISDPLKGATKIGKPCGKSKLKFPQNLVQHLVQHLV